MKKKHTNRGFGYYEFKDSSGLKCTLQLSSTVTPRIWLGLNKPDIKEYYPVPRETAESWFDVEDLSPLKHRPQNTIHAFSRMHLSKAQVKKLIPILQKFVETGEI